MSKKIFFYTLSVIVLFAGIIMIRLNSGKLNYIGFTGYILLVISAFTALCTTVTNIVLKTEAKKNEG